MSLPICRLRFGIDTGSQKKRHSSASLMNSGCALVKLSVFPLDCFLDALRGRKTQCDTADMLRSNVQPPGDLAVFAVRPGPRLFSKFLCNQAKMSVQIETPWERSDYTRGFIAVKDKSEGVEQDRAAFGARIRGMRRAKGLNQTEFAKLFGVTQVAVSRWEKGDDLPNHIALAKLAAMTSDEDLRQRLLAETGIESLTGTSFSRGLADMVRAVPLLRDPVAAGTPRATDEREIEQTLVLPKAWFPLGGELYAVRIRGDSMAPIVNDGYIVIINTAVRDPKRLVEKMVAAREGRGLRSSGFAGTGT